MTEFAKRMYTGIGSVVLFALAASLLFGTLQNNLIKTSIFSGLLLLFMVIFLIGLNWRKHFSFLPIGKASTWLQIHVYVGWASIVMFLIHTGGRSANGGLESTISFLFLTVAASGVLGLGLSRLIPRRLTQKGGNIAFEDIPKLKKDIKVQAEDLAIKSIEQTKKSTISDFYVERVEVFLLGSRRFFWNHLFGSQKHLNPLLTRMRAMYRYLNDDEIQIMKKLEELVCERDLIESQHSLLSLLKWWLFVHIPLSYSLLIFAIVHGIFAYRFVGG